MKKLISYLLICSILFTGASGLFASAADTSNILTFGDFSINTDVDFVPGDAPEAQIFAYKGKDSVVNVPAYLGEYQITAVRFSAFQTSSAASPLRQINIPETVVDMNETSNDPLKECLSCTAIYVDADNPFYSSENGVLYSKDFTRLIRVPCAYEGETFTVKTGVQIIGRGAFANCRFTNIEFPETVLYVEQDFIDCSAVEELYFPNSLEGISYLAFHQTEKLNFVYFGANVKINEGFCQYDEKTTFDVYGNISGFGVSGNNPYLSVEDGILFNKDKTQMICYPKGKKAETYVVPDSVKELSNYAFSGAEFTTLNTNMVEVINKNSLNASRIQHIILGEAVKTVTINSCFLSIYNQSWTFLSKDCQIESGSYSATKRTIYGYYGSTAFQYYVNHYWKDYMDFVFLDEETQPGFQYTELSNDSIRIDSYIGFDTALEIPAYIDGKKVVQIGANAFSGNTTITSLTLPETLETIDSRAFDALTNVTTLTIPSSVRKIASFAISGMSTLSKLYINSFDCEINDGALPKTKVFACTGSTAESYAGRNELSFFSIGHQFVSEEIENNKIRKTCSLCGYTEVVDNPNIHHEYAAQVIAPTCTEQGYTIYTCSLCGDSYITDYKAALGHETFEIKATSPTCKVEGKTAGIQCARCQLILKEQEPIATLPHEYDGGNVTTAPTCTQEGVKTYCCRNCDAFYTEPLEKIAHDYITFVMAPTCTETGYTTYTCSACGESYTADETPLQPHTPQEIPAVAATCTQEGSTKGSRCAVCALVLEAPQSISKLPHEYDGGKITLAPTCKKEGTKTFTCKHCTASYTQTLAKVDHTYTVVVKKAASFSQNGVLNEACSMCQQLRKSTVVKSLKAAKLSATVLTYTGKNLTAPKVTVTDSAGKTVAAKYYTVTYISRANSKAVKSISAIGQYKVKITFKNAYSGTKYLYFTVKPRTITQYTPATAKKAITAKWKKDTSATGYQVVIATNKSFTAGKKVYALKNSLTSKKITGLKSGKVYYVRVRAYKKIVVDGKKLNIYSSYSAIKKVKCK
ncbi:MAG: leucine-rich repeat protein [Clostridia bacterium]|nr:leucine-rich repeat protein [Clostridia bacterium]